MVRRACDSSSEGGVRAVWLDSQDRQPDYRSGAPHDRGSFGEAPRALAFVRQDVALQATAPEEHFAPPASS